MRVPLLQLSTPQTTMAAHTFSDEKINDNLHLESSPDGIDEKVAPGDTNVPDGFLPSTAEEKTLSRGLNRKLDIFLLPFLSLLYLFNGLDRGNVGNAETQGKISIGSATHCIFKSPLYLTPGHFLLQGSRKILVLVPMI